MIMIPLPPEIEAAVREAAALDGVTEEQYVLEALQHELAPLRAPDAGLHPAWGAELARRDAEIVSGAEQGIAAEDAFAAVDAALEARATS